MRACTRFWIGAPFAALVLLGSLAGAAAQAPDGFRSPSGNIHCQFWPAPSGREADATIRCDLMRITNRAPPRPRDCDLEWGQAFEISGGARQGVRLCHGDTVRDDGLPVLPYGRSFQRAGLTCLSEESGVRCVNGRGHGFEIARARQTVF